MNRLTAMPAALGAPYKGNTPQPEDPYAEFMNYSKQHGPGFADGPASEGFSRNSPYNGGPTDEALVQTALTYIEDARIHFTAHDRDRRLVMHAEGLPRVEYFPLKNRWREAGSNKRHHGTVDQFVAWYRERAGVRK